MDLNKIGNFLTYLRKEKKLTQEQLAEELAVSNKSISKWERGICLPEITTIHQITKFFDISLMEFYKGERVKEVEDKVINETLNISKNKKKIKKNLLFIIICFIIIILLFIYSIYNKHFIYNISSSSEEFTGIGNITLSKNKSLITLIDLSIVNEIISNKEGYAFEYSLTLGDVLIYHNGDIYSFDNNSTKLTLGEYVKDISIYIKDNFSSLITIDKLKNNNLVLKIIYINEELEIEEYIMEFDISKSISKK